MSRLKASYFNVNLGTTSSPRLDALLALLDDQAPMVRAALHAEFARIGPEAIAWLETVAMQGSRHDSWHARQHLQEMHVCDPVADFRSFIRSQRYELESGMILLARTVDPEVEVQAVSGRLDALAQRARELISEPCSLREKCRIVSRVIFAEAGLVGNTEHYTDPANSFIQSVLERGKGIPLSLCVVYLLVGQRLGLPVEPVALPGHFVVGCYADEIPFFIDCFEGGSFRSPGELFTMMREHHFNPSVTDLAPTPVREVLCRACRNLAQHYAAGGDLDHARLFTSFVEDFEQVHEQQLRG